MTDIADAGQTERLPEMTFYFELTSMRPTSATYASDEGFSRSFTLFGTTARGSDGLYRDKSVRVILAAPASERLAAFAAEHGVSRPCGSILIRKGVDQRHHDEGPPDPAIQIAIAVDHDTLDRLHEAARGAIDGRKVLGLNLMASSSAFEGLGYGWPRPEDLDVTEDRAYPVVAFSLSPMLACLPDPSNMRPKRPRTEARRSTTTIFVRVKSARADLESWSMKYGRIQIEGTVTAPASHKGMHADVDMIEYEADFDTGAYPKEAYPGDFAFYPPNRPFDRAARPFFSLSFRLTEHDLERVVPLLVASGDAVLQVIIGASQADIDGARDTINGDIISYTLSLGSEKP